MILINQNMKFLLDTNFLMIPGKFKVDVFEELKKFGKPEFFTLSSVVKELENLSSGKGKNSKYARIGLQLLEKNKVKILSAAKDVDSEILNFAEKQEFVICTLDKELKNRAVSKGIKVVFLRQKKYLDIK
ncbi:MAG: DNA-binding protein [Candidatus Omnitrophota bacterium]|nr:MAG: DNA-binding protein [Candidatus Omnitrophota bacterium]